MVGLGMASDTVPHNSLKPRAALTFCAQQTVPFLKTENGEGLHSTFQVMSSHCCLFKGRHASSHAPARQQALHEQAPLADTWLPLAVLVGRAWNNCQIQWPTILSWLKTTHKDCSPEQTRWKSHMKKRLDFMQAQMLQSANEGKTGKRVVRAL